MATFLEYLTEIASEIYSSDCQADTGNFDLGNRDKIIANIQAVTQNIINCLAQRKEPTFGDTSRNQCINISFVTSKKKVSCILFVMSRMFRLLITNKFVTKRELYYENVKRFESQTVINRAVHDICRILSIPIWQMRIQGTAKGLIAGPVTLVMKNGETINGDCSNGALIPQNVIDITEITSPAKWVLLVEKDAAFQRLIQEGGLQRLGPCLFITGKGFPDVNTRMLVCLLRKHLKIPILALVDADPHGIDIMCVYRFGSEAMSTHSAGLACPAVRWLGVHPTDITRLGVKSIPLTPSDTDKLQSMLSRPALISNKAIHSQIRALLDGGVKAEMEGLLNFSTSYLTESYLPSKIICKEYL